MKKISEVGKRKVKKKNFCKYFNLNAKILFFFFLVIVVVFIYIKNVCINHENILKVLF